MQRLSRAGREREVLNAIKRLESRGRFMSFTQGEICRAMGMRSTSRMRDMLLDMSDRGLLACGTTAIDGYRHEIRIFSIRQGQLEQEPLSYGTYINGEWVEMSGEVINDHVAI